MPIPLTVVQSAKTLSNPPVFFFLAEMLFVNAEYDKSTDSKAYYETRLAYCLLLISWFMYQPYPIVALTLFKNVSICKDTVSYVMPTFTKRWQFPTCIWVIGWRLAYFNKHRDLY